MNHNGVISLPTDGASTYTAGTVVSIDVTATPAIQALVGVPDSNAGIEALGVVLHDVKADETARPVDVQLFSAGGAALVKCHSTGTPTAVGHPCYIKQNESGIRVAATTAKLIGFALEVGENNGVIRVALV